MAMIDGHGIPIQHPAPRRPFELPNGNSSTSSDGGGGGGGGNGGGNTSTTGKGGRGGVEFSERWLDPSFPLQTDIPEPGDMTPSKRSRSVVSLTSSTLFGIYGKSYTEEPMSPALLTRSNSATNMQDLKPLTPLLPRENDQQQEDAQKRQQSHSRHTRHESQHQNRPKKTSTVGLMFRVLCLFVFGVAYGVIVTHLHDRSTILPTKASSVFIDFERWSPRYLVFWGLAGVGLGSLLPWLDRMDPTITTGEAKWDWNPAVRSIGAFVGIAYAIRRLPWQSTLQVSLALALVNPFLWFVLDRTRSGFWFASLAGIAGTAFLFQTNPEMIKNPAQDLARNNQDFVTIGPVEILIQNIALGTWISSVLFCSCVCFGNVGRKLASNKGMT